MDLLTPAYQLALARRPLPEAIYLALREKILTGGYRLGEALRQESLAKEFELEQSAGARGAQSP